MRVQMSRFTAGSFHERFDLGAPFRFYLFQADLRKSFYQGGIL